MAIPSFTEFIDPLLRYLVANPDGVRAADAYDPVGDLVGLSQEDRDELLPSGRQAVYKNRIGWAQDRLKRGGLSSSPRRGNWTATQKGRDLASEFKQGLPQAEVHRLAYPGRDSKMSDEGDEAKLPSVPPSPMGPLSPEERIEEAAQELDESAAGDLLELILAGSPTFFEKLVLHLLHAMGYGTSRADLKRVGGSGDGGIDGIISLDMLGLEKVYVQAKRWQNRVGRPEIQSFFGALAGRRATKGVFITTSDYSRDAREYAQQVSDSIVLVDGARLTSLMIQHGVGVTHKTVRLPQIDSDYFEDG